MTTRAIKNISLATALGVFGAAVLVLSHMFFTRGKYLLIPYAVFVVASTAVIRAEQLLRFRERFAIGLGAFTIASVVFYIALLLSPQTVHLSLLGHAWRVAFIVAIGVAINLPAARLAAPVERSSVEGAAA